MVYVCKRERDNLNYSTYSGSGKNAGMDVKELFIQLKLIKRKQ